MKGIHAIGIIDKQAGTFEAVYLGGAFPGVKWRLSGEIRGMRISREIVIKGNVFLKNYNHMLDGRLCWEIIPIIGRGWVNRHERDGGRGRHSHGPGKALVHKTSLLGILSLERHLKTQGTDAPRGRSNSDASEPVFGA
jgi:hypothetical protein